MAAYSGSRAQLAKIAEISTDRPLMVGNFLIMTKVDEQRPWGRELPGWNLVLRMYHSNDRPGWHSVEIDYEGNIVHEWDGGLD